MSEASWCHPRLFLEAGAAGEGCSPATTVPTPVGLLTGARHAWGNRSRELSIDRFTPVHSYYLHLVLNILDLSALSSVKHLQIDPIDGNVDQGNQLFSLPLSLRSQSYPDTRHMNFCFVMVGSCYS